MTWTLVCRILLPSENFASKIKPVLIWGCGFATFAWGLAKVALPYVGTQWPHLKTWADWVESPIIVMGTISGLISLFLLLTFLYCTLMIRFLRIPLAKFAARRMRSSIERAGKLPDFLKALHSDANASEWLERECSSWVFLNRVEAGHSITDLALDMASRQFEHIGLTEYWFSITQGVEAGASELVSKLTEVIEKLEKTCGTWINVEKSGNRRPHYVKGISNPVAESYAAKALQLPFLYRLNFMRQIGTLGLGPNLDAAHNRLAHACGTAESAALLIEALGRNFDHHFSRVELPPSPKDAVLVGALLHDAFSGPFGHSIDMLKSVLIPYNHTRRLRADQVLLRQALSEARGTALTKSAQGGVVRAIIKNIVTEEDRIESVLDLLRFIFDPEKYLKRGVPLPIIRSESGELCESNPFAWYFLAEILDSPALDADRFDYVVRDSLHLGQPVFEKNEWIDVLMRTRVVDQPNPHSSTGVIKRLAFSKEHLPRIARFLNVRRRLYHTSYESPEKIVWDDMLCHVISYHFEAAHLIDPAKESEVVRRESAKGKITSTEEDAQTRTLHEVRQKIFRWFMLLTDEDLFPFLEYLRSFCDQDILVQCLRDMATDLKTNRPFVRVCTYEMTQEQWNESVSNPTSTDQSDWYRTADNDELLSEFTFLYTDDFWNRLRLERVLWQRLLDNSESVRDHWKAFITRKYPDRVDNFYNATHEWFPGVHLTIPRMTMLPGEAAEQRDKYDPETGDPLVVCYDSQGGVKARKLRGMLARHRYRLLASVPYCLHEVPNIGGPNGIVHNALMDVLRMDSTWK